MRENCARYRAMSCGLCFVTRPEIFLFFFNDTATTEIYTLSLHDALPICAHGAAPHAPRGAARRPRSHRYEGELPGGGVRGDRKSTRLNSSHSQISYAVFCLKKKNPACSVAPSVSISPILTIVHTACTTSG